MQLLSFIKKRSISAVVSIVSLLLITNAVLIYHNKNIMVRNAAIIRKSDEITGNVNGLVVELLHNLEMGIRGYGVTKDVNLLGPTLDAIKVVDNRFDNIKTALDSQQYDVVPLENLRKAYHDYMDFVLEMKKAADLDSMQRFKAMMKEDRGLQVFLKWVDTGIKIMDYEKGIKAEANIEYQSAVNNNLYLQAFILLIGLPTLGFVIYKIQNDDRQRQLLLMKLEENNRKYIFDPGTAIEATNPEKVIGNSIVNLQQANEFIENIAEGKYTAEWTGLNDANEALNKTSLAGRLTNMRAQLKQMKREEERRLWTNEGLNGFSEIVRNNQSNLMELSNSAIRFLTQYLGAQQGGLFVLREEGEDSYLELAACYAFDRKKFMERRIDIGVGLIGQAYLEGETTLLTKLPQGYTYITSGMGEATPGCLVIVPMKYNDKIEAIIEIASLEKLEDHQISFLEKAGEFIASALQSVRTTEKMQQLLSVSQRQTEEMRATEEELRQNLEELQATQEAMIRKQEELNNMRGEDR
ncbi:GAF domain-containing protein [Ohtaekwangia sp.]|uniref:GAF domain-containing protein n=1 Tax=Ohtaekwangia sp. TaxID=2066019 RepID=UPI002FDCBAE0